jgi:uncharacterized iron-regulated membrane protein
LRKALFWIHLAAGVFAGALIIFFAVTGSLLAYERPILHAIDRHYFPSSSASPNAVRIPLDDLLARATSALPAPVEMITMHPDPNAPVELQLANRNVYFADPFSGNVQGPTSPHTRSFFAEVTALHRWFGLSDASHATATAVKGVVALLFLFLVLSGPILWLPKLWTRTALRAGVVPRFDTRGRARNYNWHKTTGFWLALPLLVIVSTGVVMAYPWANRLLFQLAKSPLPVRNSEAANPRRRTHGSRPFPTHLDQAFASATKDSQGWQSATLRIGPGGPGLNITVDQGDGGQPQKREQVTINPKSMEVARREPFAAMTRGQQWRAWVRFSHTGEAGGWWGETLALITACGAIALSLTGIVLSWDRLQRWRRLSNPTVARSLVSR